MKQVSIVPDETEEFEHVFIKKSKIDSLIKSNKIWDSMTMAAWFLAKDHI